jgi:hypothetical protein
MGKSFRARALALHHGPTLRTFGARPSPFRGGSSDLVLAMRLHPRRCHALAMASPQPRHFHFRFPQITREAEHRTVHLLPGKSGRELPPLPGTAAVLMTRAAHLRCSTIGLMEVAFQPGPGQRFLESPDANGSSALPLRHQCSQHLTVRTRAGRA